MSGATTRRTYRCAMVTMWRMARESNPRATSLRPGAFKALSHSNCYAIQRRRRVRESNPRVVLPRPAAFGAVPHADCGYPPYGGAPGTRTQSALRHTRLPNVLLHQFGQRSIWRKLRESNPVIREDVRLSGALHYRPAQLPKLRTLAWRPRTAVSGTAVSRRAKPRSTIRMLCPGRCGIHKPLRIGLRKGSLLNDAKATVIVFGLRILNDRSSFSLEPRKAPGLDLFVRMCRAPPPKT